MPEPNWSLRGEYMESCNCDYLCPCVYTNPQGPVTHDTCMAVLVFRIDEGRAGATRLDGVKFAQIIRSGKIMADGNWVFGVIIDAAADAAQREALGRIAGGEAGGTPGLIRQNLVTDYRGILYAPTATNASVQMTISDDPVVPTANNPTPQATLQPASVTTTTPANTNPAPIQADTTASAPPKSEPAKTTKPSAGVPSQNEPVMVASTQPSVLTCYNLRFRLRLGGADPGYLEDLIRQGANCEEDVPT